MVISHFFCQQRWKETWDLLKKGGFEAFFSKLGRFDLIRATAESLSESDADRGVDYFLSRLPAEMDPAETAAVVVMALTLSLLATLYPSWRAARLDPVEALRYE